MKGPLHYVWTPQATGAGSASIVFSSDPGFIYTIVGIIGVADGNANNSNIVLSNIRVCNLSTFVMETGLVTLGRTAIATAGSVFYYPPSDGWAWSFDGATPATVTITVAAVTNYLQVAFIRAQQGV